MSGDGKSTAFSLVRLSCCWWSALRRLPAVTGIRKNSIPRNSDHKFGERKKCYFFCFEANY